jgi:hypothetical protein
VCLLRAEAECAPLRNPRTGLCLVRDYYDEWLDAWILTMGPCFSNQVVCLKVCMGRANTTVSVLQV